MMSSGLARTNSLVVPRFWKQWCWDISVYREENTLLPFFLDISSVSKQMIACGIAFFFRLPKNVLHCKPAVLHRTSLFSQEPENLIKLIHLLCLHTYCFPLPQNQLKIWTGGKIVWSHQNKQLFHWDIRNVVKWKRFMCFLFEFLTGFHYPWH